MSGGVSNESHFVKSGTIISLEQQKFSYFVAFNHILPKELVKYGGLSHLYREVASFYRGSDRTFSPLQCALGNVLETESRILKVFSSGITTCICRFSSAQNVKEFNMTSKLRKSPNYNA